MPYEQDESEGWYGHTGSERCFLEYDVDGCVTGKAREARVTCEMGDKFVSCARESARLS